MNANNFPSRLLSRLITFLICLGLLATGSSTAGATSTKPLHVNENVYSGLNLPEAIPILGLESLLRVSVASDGTQGNKDSHYPAISADGRYVAFHSEAETLIPNDTNGAVDVFVHDRQTGLTELVSVSSEGVQGDSTSEDPSISADGRYVAFWSYASNLIPGISTWDDVFVHDRWTKETTIVSVTSEGEQSCGDHPSISADGRYVAFQSLCTNLVPHDANTWSDVFVRDRDTGITEIISVASDGTQGNYESHSPVISTDGRYVAFESSANNLVPGDTNGVKDLFVRDRTLGTTDRISVASDGTQSNDTCSASSCSLSISADGRYVAFHSFADNLVPGDTKGRSDVFVHDRQTGETTRISLGWHGAQSDDVSFNPSISPDGRYVAYESIASNLAPGDSTYYFDVFIFDRLTGITNLVSVNNSGNIGNSYSRHPVLSADMQWIAYSSEADNLVPGDTNESTDIFLARWEVEAYPLTFLPAVFRH